MIIVIEDHKYLARVLALLLEPAEVVVCGTMAEAAKLTPGADDTIVVDLNLPDSRPIATLNQVIKWKDLADPPKVIIITGSDDERLLKAARMSPADGLALKKDGEKFYRQLMAIGSARRTEPCADRALVEEIEIAVAHLIHCSPA